MDKFGRRYQLSIGTVVNNLPGPTIEIELPFTVQFDIIRNTLTSANNCQLRIYNLGKLARNLIRHNLSDYGEYRPIVFKAGYGSNLPIIFKGNSSQAWSVREGVDFITQIECFDGGFAFQNAKTDQQFPAGVPRRSIFQALIKDLEHVSEGVIGPFPGVLSRGNSISGSTTAILSEMSGGAFFIDKGKANVLGTDEYILSPGGTVLVNANSGLLGTPQLERYTVRFEMIFEPSLDVGYKVKLESSTEENFNGDYKITAVKHRGMISDSVCGEVITTGEFFYTKELVGIPALGI